MIVKVTQEHIENGCHLSTNCPVALALKDATGQDWECDGCWIYAEIDGVYRDFIAPRSVHDFVDYFDERMPVEPFEFEFPIEKLVPVSA